MTVARELVKVEVPAGAHPDAPIRVRVDKPAGTHPDAPLRATAAVVREAARRAREGGPS